VAQLYNTFNTRTEGFATAFEELMLHAGMGRCRMRSDGCWDGRQDGERAARAASHFARLSPFRANH